MPPKQKTPAFTSIAQPGYIWEEFTIEKPYGVTSFSVNDNTARIFFPPDDTPVGRTIRLHEMLHARFTPEVNDLANFDSDNPSLRAVCEQIAEDIRLVQIARKLDLFADDIYLDSKSWIKEYKDNKQAAVHYMAGYGQPADTKWNTKSASAFGKVSGWAFQWKVKKLLKSWSRQVEKITKHPDGRHQFQELVRVTEETLKKLSGTPPKHKKPARSSAPSKSKGGGSGKNEEDNKNEAQPEQAESGEEEIPTEWLPPKIIPRPQDLQELMEEGGAPAPGDEEEEDEQEGSNAPSGFGGGGKFTPRLTHQKEEGPPIDGVTVINYSDDAQAPEWGEMHTRIAPMERNFKAIVKRNGVASPEGAMPRHLNRWFGDKNVFERKGRRRGGTLLIDISGSMSWSREQIKKLIEEVPAMTVAMYSGSDKITVRKDGMEYHDYGHLTIIAKDGRLVSEDFDPRKGKPGWEGHGGYNIVDGPALSWLCKQQRPRVWLSDGEVTGIVGGGNDCQPRSVQQDAARLCHLGSITRVNDKSGKKVLKIFTGRG